MSCFSSSSSAVSREIQNLRNEIKILATEAKRKNSNLSFQNSKLEEDMIDERLVSNFFREEYFSENKFWNEPKAPEKANWRKIETNCSYCRKDQKCFSTKNSNGDMSRWKCWKWTYFSQRKNIQYGIRTYFTSWRFCQFKVMKYNIQNFLARWRTLVQTQKTP